MASLIEPLVALAVGAMLALTGLLKRRGGTDLRAEVRQDIELRQMLEMNQADQEARTALTLSIRRNAIRLQQDQPDWFIRWGIQWLLPVAAILVLVGMRLGGSSDDAEFASGVQLALDLAGLVLMTVGGVLIGHWAVRLVELLSTRRDESSRSRKQRKNSSKH